jgi:ParB family chromosome partitioning protein
MTETVLTDAGRDDTTAHPGTLEHLDPATLNIGDNVRDGATVGRDFLDSIRTHGVLVPITAVRSLDRATVTVRNGQRRTLAAREAALATVPVYVLETGAEDGDTVARIVHQIVTNDHKADLTDAQRARGIQQMLDTGLSATKVAKQLAVPRTTVKAAAAAANSDAAMTALADGQLSLTEAATLAEFDDPHAVGELLAVAGTWRFEHTAAQIRLRQLTEQAYDAAAAQYTADGYRVITDYPNWRDRTCVALRYLRTGDDNDVTEEAINDPAHWAVYLEEGVAYLDAATGDPVEEDDIDLTTRRRPDAEPASGLRHAATVTETAVFEPEWFCTDYTAAGLHLVELLQNSHPIGTGGAPRGSDDDATRQERQREARRKTVALNKLGDAAITVRRAWIKDTLLARKTPPKQGAVFVADCLSRDRRLLDEHLGEPTAADLLGLGAIDDIRTAISGLGAGGDNRAQVITLALVLGALEARTPKDAWRTTDTRWGQFVTSADYLKFLRTQGYPLSAIEETILGEHTPEQTYADTEH